MAFLSVIVPTFNSERTIGACLRSLAIQSFKNFEILIIDGVSTDNTLCLIKEFSANHPQLDFKIITEKDSGIFHAMNKGAGMAKGECLYFLGSDDSLINNDVFEMVCAELSKQDSADFMYGNVLMEATGQVYDGEFSFRHLLKSNICHQSIFIKKTLFEEFGPFDLRFEVHADWDFNLKVFLAKKKTQFINTLIVRYGNQGFSSDKRDLNFEEKLLPIKEKFYRDFKNRFNSRVHYLRKRIVKYFLLGHVLIIKCVPDYLYEF